MNLNKIEVLHENVKRLTFTEHGHVSWLTGTDAGRVQSITVTLRRDGEVFLKTLEGYTSPNGRWVEKETMFSLTPENTKALIEFLSTPGINPPTAK